MKSKIISILENLFEKNWVLVLFVKVISVYLMSFLLLFGVYKLLMGKEIVLYLLVMLILVGLVLDTRIEGKRKVIFSVLLVLHVVFWEYGYWQTEIVWIKEIFWYSLVMLGCFVWHVLILNWIYKLVEYWKWEYGKYVISRISLTSSMMGIIWILQWGIYILEKKNYYEVKKENNRKKFIFTWSNLLLVCLYILLVICEYFSFIFQGYVKMIIGKGGRIRLREIPIKYYVFIIVTLYISYTIGVPRIYLIWVVLLVWNIIKLLKRLYECKWIFAKRQNILDLPLELIRIEMTIKHSKRFTDLNWGPLQSKSKDRLTKDWYYLYSEGLYEDYICYSELDYWSVTKACFTLVIDIYHPWFDVFNYSEDRLLKVLGRISYNYWIHTQYYWTQELEKIEDISDLEDEAEDLLSCYPIRVKVDKLIPYILEAEKNCIWKNRNDGSTLKQYSSFKDYIKEKQYKYKTNLEW